MVGTHLLPPNLLKLFAPRPPLPYLKPTGRDIGRPVKHSAKAPSPITLADTLRQIKADKEAEEARIFEQGRSGVKKEAAKVEAGEETKTEDEAQGEDKKDVDDKEDEEDKPDDEDEEAFMLIGEEARIVRREEKKRLKTERLEKGIKECKRVLLRIVECFR